VKPFASYDGSTERPRKDRIEIGFHDICLLTVLVVASACVVALEIVKRKKGVEMNEQEAERND
jgi:hypothetical protein